MLSAGTSSVILTCNDLRKSFGRVVALNGVSIAFEAGEITAIIGPNGSGKSTVVNVLTGFCFADRGSVKWSGQDITSEPAYKRARLGISRTFQDLKLPTRMTVGELMSFTSLSPDCSLFSLPRHTERVTKTLASMGLGDLSRQVIGELSWGQRKLVSVACALSRSHSGVVLLDEPCSGVNDRMVQEIAKVIITAAKGGCSVVVVEHNLRFVKEFSTRTVLMESGSVAASGETHSVFGALKQLRPFLGLS